jgi:hypothetical protein
LFFGGQFLLEGFGELPMAVVGLVNFVELLLERFALSGELRVTGNE